MSTYVLPRTSFDLLGEALGEKQKVKSQTKAELRDELRNELVTRELFEEGFKALGIEINERFNVVDEKFRSLNFKLNIFITIALIALTFANPTFVMLIERIFGIK